MRTGWRSGDEATVAQSPAQTTAKEKHDFLVCLPYATQTSLASGGHQTGYQRWCNPGGETETHF